MKKFLFSLLIMLLSLSASYVTAFAADEMFIDFENFEVGKGPTGWEGAANSLIQIKQPVTDGNKFLSVKGAYGVGYPYLQNEAIVTAGDKISISFVVTPLDKNSDKKIGIRHRTNVSAGTIYLLMFFGEDSPTYSQSKGKMGFAPEIFRTGNAGATLVPNYKKDSYEMNREYHITADIDRKNNTISMYCDGERVIDNASYTFPSFTSYGLRFDMSAPSTSAKPNAEMYIDDIMLYKGKAGGNDCIAYPYFKDDAGRPISEFNGREIYAYAKTSNNGAADKNIMLAAVLYKDGKIEKAWVENNVLPAQSGGAFTETQKYIYLPQNAENSLIKLFLWDSDSLKAVSDVRVFNIGEFSMVHAEDILADFSANAAQKGRPRLLTDTNNFASAVNSTDPDVGAWRNWIITTRASWMKNVNLSDFNGDMLSAAKTALMRVQMLTLAYKTTGDSAYKNAAETILLHISSFSDWNPSHFLDVAEMTAAVAIGYDWLYNDLSADTRNKLKNAIINKGLIPGNMCYDGKPGAYGDWVNVDTNWNAVCNGGLALGALAIMDDDPELASNIIYKGLCSLRKATHHFAPDGAWFEGPNYWEYTVSYTGYHIAALKGALGTDYGYSNIEGLSDTCYYGIYLNGANSSFNLDDTLELDSESGGLTGSPAMMLFGDIYNNKHFVTARRNMLNRKIQDGGNPAVASAPSVTDILWYKPELLDNADNPPLSKYFRDSEVAVFRTGWDKNAAFGAIHGGYNNNSHGDLDAGQFVIDLSGERFAMDLGRDNYNLANYFDAAYRWRIYRKRAEGHNTLVMNLSQTNSPADQAVNSFSPIERYSIDDNFAVVDMTAAYAPWANSVKRGMMYKYGGFIIKDEAALKTASDVYWFMHTRAEIDISSDKKSAVLTIGDKRVWAGIIGNAGEFSKMEAKALPTTPKVTNEAVNSGIIKLTILLENVSEVDLAVALIPLENGQNAPAQTIIAENLCDWGN